jgi:hypothetical protein
MPSTHEIPLSEAVKKTQRFLTISPNGTKRGFWIDRSAIEELLNMENPSCEGFRIYLAAEEENADDLTIVIVATDNLMNDITEKVMNRALKCPDFCDENSPL